MKILLRGGGDLASAVAYTLFKSGFQVIIVELAKPLVIRRTISFASIITDGKAQVEDVSATLMTGLEQLYHLKKNILYITTLPEEQVAAIYKPDVFIDATLSKKPVDYHKGYADLVIGLGPEITAGADADFVIETNRGHNLGRIISDGKAIDNTGEPGVIDGHSSKRVHYSQAGGTFKAIKKIGDSVIAGDVIAAIGNKLVTANIDGVIRGMIKEGNYVGEKTKIADVDPRGDASYCHTISDKGRNIAGAVLETIMRRYNREGKL